MRLIDADALKYYGNHIGDEYEDYFHETQWVYRSQIDTAPSIDIVRCKECKYASDNKVYGCMLNHFNNDDYHRMYADDFCSYGEVSEKPNSSEKPNNSTISKMEQVDEPKTQMKTQNSNLTFEKVMKEIQTQVIEFPDTHQEFVFTRKIEMDGDSITICDWEYKGVKDGEREGEVIESKGCVTCKHTDKEWYEEPCEDCHGNSGYERKESE